MILQPSTSQLQMTQKPRKPKRKDTQVPQPSDPTDIVADEAVHKELGDILMRATTIASSLEAEHESGKIDKTQSKVTPNKSSSQGTDLGGGPRCQEAIEDTIAQTRFEIISKLSNDSLFARDQTKTTQANEIAILKRMVKKLKKRNKSRIYKLKRLYKVGLTARVESSDNDESLGEDASKKERRINDIDADEEITLDDVQAKIDADYQLAKGIQAEEQEELSDIEKAILFMQLLEKRRKLFAAKRVEEKRNKPPTQDQQRKIMCTYLKNMEGYTLKQLESFKFDKIQEMFDKAFKRMFDKAFKRVNTFKDFKTELVQGKEKIIGEELVKEISRKQKVDDDKETQELKQLMEIITDKEEVAIDAIPLAIKSLGIVD
nr:hypothetical protein [Tanacetum cinerariifolium]